MYVRVCLYQSLNLVDLQNCQALPTSAPETKDDSAERSSSVQQPSRAERQQTSKGLSGLCLTTLGKPLCKHVQCSNWDVRPLSQLQYVAQDAHCLLRVYARLSLPVDVPSLILPKAVRQSITSYYLCLVSIVLVYVISCACWHAYSLVKLTAHHSVLGRPTGTNC